MCGVFKIFLDLELFAKFKNVFLKISKTHVPESLFDKVADLRPATLLKKRLRHKSFPVNFAKF